MLNFVENLLENERGPMNDQDLTKTDYDPDRSLVLIEGLSHFLTNFLQNLGGEAGFCALRRKVRDWIFVRTRPNLHNLLSNYKSQKL
jgi:hypothetical protein